MPRHACTACHGKADMLLHNENMNDGQNRQGCNALNQWGSCADCMWQAKGEWYVGSIQTRDTQHAFLAAP